MALCAFLGDELSALGFRLAGVDCYCPAPGETLDLFQRLRAEVVLLLVTAEMAADLPAEELHRAQAATRPLVLVIADVQGRVPAPDRAAAVRRQLGLAE